MNGGADVGELQHSTDVCSAGELVRLKVLGGEALAVQVREAGVDEPILLCSRGECPHFVCQHPLPGSGGQEEAVCRLAGVSPGRLCQAAYQEQAEQLHVAGSDASQRLAAAVEFEVRTARAAAIAAPRLVRTSAAKHIEQEFPTAAASKAACQVFLERGYRRAPRAAVTLWPGEVRQREKFLEWRARDQDPAAPLWELLRELHESSPFAPRNSELLGQAVVALEAGCPVRRVFEALLEACNE